MSLENEELISQLENIIAKEKSKRKKNDFQSMSKEELNKRIDKSENDSINERLTESDDLKKEMKEWF